MKDGAQVLSRSISNFAIFLLNSTSFQEVAKLLKLNHFFKKAIRPIPKTITLFHVSHCYQNLLKGLFMTKKRSFWGRTKFFSGFSRVSEKTALQTLVLDISLINYYRIRKRPFHWNDLIDLKKVFDPIDHQVLLKKMEYLGFSKNAITWFKYFLCERKFKISINARRLFYKQCFFSTQLQCYLTFW